MYYAVARFVFFEGLFTAFGFIDCFIEQIVSLDGRLDEFEDESLVSPVAHSRKPSGFEGTHRNSFSVDKQECTVEYLKARFFRSLKIVLFTAKINMLMPCGLVAVLINYITGDHVSLLSYGCFYVPVYCISMLYILVLSSFLFFFSVFFDMRLSIHRDGCFSSAC